ncbi:MAG: hypothetical protein KIT83_12525 [Bryobacterales bacterium]|nr:hypothetical protein [Bryobacterales bacterium]
MLSLACALVALLLVTGLCSAHAAIPAALPHPLQFVPNRGQFAPDIQFGAVRGGVALAVGPGFLRVLTHGGDDGREVLRAEVRWLGANPDASIAATTETATRHSFFLGRDSSRWQADLPSFAQLKVQGLYPGIDLLIYEHDELLEFDYIVHPGAHPSQIRWRMEGEVSASRHSQGHLAMDFARGAFLMREPVAYQETLSVRQPVNASYIRTEDGGWTFSLGEYDSALPLVIDPILSYSTYYGGTQFDQANAIVTDAAGNTFIVGETWSVGLLLAYDVQNFRKAGKDAFVLRMNVPLTAFAAATYFGGNGDDIATSATIVGSDLLMAGETASTDLPGTTGRYQPTSGGGKDGFITRLRLILNPAIIATTYLGGFGTDRINAVTRDATGNIYAAGSTTSSNFPLSTPSFGPQYLGGTNDAFVAKFNSTLTQVAWSGIYGGLGADNAHGIALGAGGTVWITGSTSSASIPLVNAAQTVLLGSYDCFVAQIAASGLSLLQSTYLGGGNSDWCYAIQTESAGHPVVAGSSASSSFPITSGVVQPLRSGDYDNVLFKLNGNTGYLIFSTFLGGSGTEAPASLHQDAQGNWCMAGYTASTNLPVFDAVQANHGGSLDGYFSCLNADATALVFSTYLGGTQEDRITGAAERPGSLTMLTGMTHSLNFPIAGSALQPTSKGSGDAFLTGINRSATNAPPVNVSVSPPNGNTETAQLTYTVDDANGWSDLKFVYANIHNVVSPVNACYVQFDVDNNLLRLLNDAGTAWVGAVAPGERTVLQNSQCRIDAERSSVWAHATRLQLTVFYVFQPGFGGVKSLLMYSQDRANTVAGWQLRGGWVVPALAGNVQPSVTYFAPNSGTFPQNAFVMQVTDLNGANDTNEVHLLINATFSYGAACYIRYRRAQNQLQLLNDSTSQFLGALTPGVSGTVENSKCLLSGAYSSASMSGNVLSLVVYLSFKTLAGGTNQVWTLVNDQSSVFLGWKSQGSFTVPIGPAFTKPVAHALSITPLSSTTATIAATGFDENGAGDIRDIYLLVNSSLSTVGGCYLLYRSPTQQVFLLNDAGSNWQGVGVRGSETILENSQCRVNLVLAAKSSTQDTETISYRVEFKPTFHGARSAYLYVEDAAKLVSGWKFFSTIALPFP